MSTPSAIHRRPHRPALRFEDRPILVFWETTKACALSCRHCRATAVPRALPGELTTNEGFSLLDQVASFGKPSPILVLTGGDCLARPDLLSLAQHARGLGIPIALSPSVTPRLTPRTLAPFAELGVSTISISLDGACPSTHDEVRGVPGHFEETLFALNWLQRSGFKVQVNTTVMGANRGELADVAGILHSLDIPIWEVFFLVKVGRGTEVSALSAKENEDVCNFLYEASGYGTLVRTVEAPFYRRVVVSRQSRREQNNLPAPEHLGPLYSQLSSRLVELLGPQVTGPISPTVSTRDGMGVIFIGHDGSVQPSGFLPLALGNVRSGDLAGIYRDHHLLRAIRAAQFSGRCKSCSFAELCGGSRARAYAATGDPLGEDPGCYMSRV